MGKDVIVACDFSNEKEVYEFLDIFKEEKPFVKIGMELFYGAGPEIVKKIKGSGHKIFLDLKCHDIPNTVKKTMKVLAGLKVDICNLHAAGTSAMMKAAMEGLIEGSENPNERPLLIAVTQLTSTEEKVMKEELLIDRPLDEVVKAYALNARNSGLDGVVCSPLEASKVHEVCGQDFLTVTPGVRFKDSKKDDQRRVMTPAEAKIIGSDYIVVGRPITEAEDPIIAYRKCVEEFLS